MTHQNFQHLIDNTPESISEVYISDLHLLYDDEDPTNNSLYDAFLAFLDILSTLPNLKKLYILGDWFEIWIGDDAYLKLTKEDKPTHWITAIVSRLKQLRIDGCHVFIMVGNRDFLMRQPFCNTFIGQMISEPYYTQIGEKRVRLEHGDALCTDDAAYQRFRKYSRKPFVQWWLLKKKLEKRQKIADDIRKKSKKANASKSMAIMDVNAMAVQAAFIPATDEQLVKRCRKKYIPVPIDNDIVIHGHTHKPMIHHHTYENPKRYDEDISEVSKKNDTTAGDSKQSADANEASTSKVEKTRYVLGDWRVQTLNDEATGLAFNQISNPNNLDKSNAKQLITKQVSAIIAVLCVDADISFDLYEYTYK